MRDQLGGSYVLTDEDDSHIVPERELLESRLNMLCGCLFIKQLQLTMITCCLDLAKKLSCKNRHARTGGGQRTGIHYQVVAFLPHIYISDTR